MHRDHYIFLQAVQDKRKLKLTFFSRDQSKDMDRICGPILYSPSSGGDDSGCYFLWDFERADSNLLALLPPQIVSMEIIEEPFDLVAFFTSRSETANS
jgi:hypothetical protein